LNQANTIALAIISNRQIHESFRVRSILPPILRMHKLSQNTIDALRAVKVYL